MADPQKKWCVPDAGGVAHAIAEVGFERKYVENPEVVCGREVKYTGYPMNVVPDCADCLAGKAAAGEPPTVPTTAEVPTPNTPA